MESFLSEETNSIKISFGENRLLYLSLRKRIITESLSDFPKFVNIWRSNLSFGSVRLGATRGAETPFFTAKV
jgi:hypothetical protein